MAISTDLGGQLGVDQLLQRLLQEATEQLLGAVITRTCQQIGIG